MGVFRTLRRDIGGTIRTSRNLNEPVTKKIRRAFWSVVYLAKGLWIGFRSMFRQQLGSQVMYQGRKLYIANWAGTEFPSLSGDGIYVQFVHRDRIRNIISIQELAHRFDVGFGWYMSSWYGIDINKRIYKWTTQPNNSDFEECLKRIDSPGSTTTDT